MPDKRPDRTLEQLTNDHSPLQAYSFGLTPYHAHQAANDPVYSEYPLILPKSNHNSDKKSAKSARFLSILIKLLKHYFCHHFSLLAAWLLDFRLFLYFIVECQNNHPLTAGKKNSTNLTSYYFENIKTKSIVNHAFTHDR